MFFSLFDSYDEMSFFSTAGNKPIDRKPSSNAPKSVLEEDSFDDGFLALKKLKEQSRKGMKGPLSTLPFCIPKMSIKKKEPSQTQWDEIDFERVEKTEVFEEICPETPKRISPVRSVLSSQAISLIDKYSKNAQEEPNKPSPILSSSKSRSTSGLR